jgi:regulator of sigma E protease
MSLVIGVVLVLGLMILVHELGHFVAAKLCGVRVERFSIGFPPRLWGVRYKGTDYCISALPLGGYVRMAGQDLSDADRGDSAAPSGKPDELLSKPRWQRAFIAFAGPAVNLILPVILLAAFFVVEGQPYPAYLDKPVQVVALPADAARSTSALQVGDKILSLNGVQNPNWEQALKTVEQTAAGGKLKMEVENAGARRSLEMSVKDAAQADRLFGYPPIRPVIDEVVPGMPAGRGGLRADDVILAVDGQAVEYWGEFVDRVRASNGRSLRLDLGRNGQVIHAEVTPQKGVNERGDTVYQVGIQARETTVYRRIGPIESTRGAVLVTFGKVTETASVVGRLFSGRVSVKQLQGVVGIARVSGEAVRQGPSSVVLLMAIISVNLGVLNLLPIPILDGGHILLLAIEGGIRRDLSLRFKERFVQVGFVFLLVLFGIVMYNDVVRILPTR